MKSVVVTGVSRRGSATGWQGSRSGAAAGCSAARKEADAARLAAELGTSFGPLVFDVTDREAVLRAAGEVGDALGGGGLAGLVNNVGITIYGPLMHQPLAEVRDEFETNVVGLISVTQAFLPLLGARRPQAHPPGRIVNIGSVNGRLATPFMAAYVGTKHAVEGVSDSLRRELLPYGIDVVVVRPGPVKTEGNRKAAEHRSAAYAKTDYAKPLAGFFEISANATEDGYSAEEFGRRAADAFEAKKPRTRYTFLRQRLTIWTIPTLLPDRLYDRLLGRAMGLLRR